MIKLNKLECIDKEINIDEYIYNMNEVKSNMSNPEWLGDFKKDDISYLLENGSKIWMYYNDNEFVSSMMIIPYEERSIKQLKLNIDYHKVIDYGPMFINKKYVGNGLQLQMLKELDSYSHSLNYEYAVGTIEPNNIYSINNLIKDDFKLINKVTLERGERNIYLKKL